MRFPDTISAARRYEYERGTDVVAHRHETAQLVYAVSGVLHAYAGRRRWTLSPTRALLVPAGCEHRHHVPVRATMLTLHFPSVDGGGRLLSVGGLGRGLIATLVAGGYDRGVQSAYLAVLRDQLKRAHPLDLEVPLPADAHPLSRLTAAFLADPADGASLETWGRRLGMSARTVSRYFRSQTGMTFDEWRRRARCSTALEHLAAGMTVERTAHLVGYSTAAAFTHAFRSLTGATPGSVFGGLGTARP